MSVSHGVQSPALAGGYRIGERVGAGVVADPTTITKKDYPNLKVVTVDKNFNRIKDENDDKLLVKLPPKGKIPAVALTAEEKSRGQVGVTFGTAVGTLLGIQTGAVLGIALMAAEVTSKRAIGGAFIGSVVLGAVAGAALGYKDFVKSQVLQKTETARQKSVPDLIPPK